MVGASGQVIPAVPAVEGEPRRAAGFVRTHLHPVGARLALDCPPTRPFAIQAAVQLTVNGDLGLNGLLVQKHAKEERNHAQDK